MKKKIFVLAYIASPLILGYAVYSSNPDRYQTSWGIFSMGLGVFAYTWFNWQFVISARPKWIEKGIGMDFLYRFHGIMALFAIGTALIHGNMKEQVYGETLMTRFGSIGNAIFIAVTVISLLVMVQSKLHNIQVLNKIRRFLHNTQNRFYEKLKKFHNIALIGQILIVVHVLMTSQVRSSILTFLAYMVVFVIAFGHYVWHKLVKPWLMTYETLKVAKIEAIKIDGSDKIFMWHIAFEKSHENLYYKPGQFAFFRFPTQKGDEEHPFTIASSPYDSYIHISVKNLGDFTQDLSGLRVGDEVLMDGPYGEFTYLNHDEKVHNLLVAGVGITPAMSMIRHENMTNDKRKLQLFWHIRKLDEAVFLDELITFASNNKEFTGYIMVDQLLEEQIENIQIPDNLHIRKSSIEATLSILKSEGHPPSSGYYLCGPGGFMDRLMKELKQGGVNAHQIHMEKFSF